MLCALHKNSGHHWHHWHYCHDNIELTQVLSSCCRTAAQTRDPRVSAAPEAQACRPGQPPVQLRPQPSSATSWPEGPPSPHQCSAPRHLYHHGGTSPPGPCTRASFCQDPPRRGRSSSPRSPRAWGLERKGCRPSSPQSPVASSRPSGRHPSLGGTRTTRSQRSPSRPCASPPQRPNPPRRRGKPQSPCTCPRLDHATFQLAAHSRGTRCDRRRGVGTGESPKGSHTQIAHSPPWPFPQSGHTHPGTRDHPRCRLPFRTSSALPAPRASPKARRGRGPSSQPS
mmetsp:Transcript_13748/g.32793  ORF Transcript_13748/g.32793 Transcript_13748/m.32793 type:complete len:283 (+) Transcript_13748:310-1158(+)